MNTGAEGKGWGRGGQAVTCAAPVYTWALLGWKGPQQGHQRGGFTCDKNEGRKSPRTWGRNKACPYCLGFGEGGGPSACLGGRAPSSQHFPLAGGRGWGRGAPTRIPHLPGACCEPRRAGWHLPALFEVGRPRSCWRSGLSAGVEELCLPAAAPRTASLLYMKCL